MPGRKYADKMHLDLPFSEALERFARTDPKHAAIARAKKKRLPSGRKAASPSNVQAENANKLRDARTKSA